MLNATSACATPEKALRVRAWGLTPWASPPEAAAQGTGNFGDPRARLAAAASCVLQLPTMIQQAAQGWRLECTLYSS
jgi:hypothetical protein